MSRSRDTTCTPRRDDSRSQWIRICDLLAAAEIAILIGQDANWCLPRQCHDWRERMDEAFRLIEREGLPRDLRDLEMEAA